MSRNENSTRFWGRHYEQRGYQPGSANQPNLKPQDGRPSEDQALPSKPPSNPPNRGSAGKK